MASVAVKIQYMRPDTAQVNEPINRSQEVVLRDVIFQKNLIKQYALRFLLCSNQRQYPSIYEEIESVVDLQIKKSFSTESALWRSWKLAGYPSAIAVSRARPQSPQSRPGSLRQDRPQRKPAAASCPQSRPSRTRPCPSRIYPTCCAGIL